MAMAAASAEVIQTGMLSLPPLGVLMTNAGGGPDLVSKGRTRCPASGWNRYRTLTRGSLVFCVRLIP
jgi:hypothetical protein